MTLSKALLKLYPDLFIIHFNWYGDSLIYLSSDFYDFESAFFDREVRIQKRDGRYHVYIKEVKE